MKTKLKKNQNGATAVEFSIILLVFLLFIFGIIEFSTYLFNKNVVTHAGREGARAGIVVSENRLTNTEIETIAKNYCENHLVTFSDSADPLRVLLKDINNDDATFDPTTQRQTRFGSDLEVIVEYDYAFLFLANFGLTPKTIRTICVMRME
jgi:Flp pilus assembly protein TadG